MRHTMIGLSRKPKNIKFHNQRLVLSLMRQNDVISASEIAQKINLSITTVVKILAVLQENGLIKSMGKGSSTDEGGKKPELFAINESYKYVIAVYGGPDFFQITATDLKCRVVSDKKYDYREVENLERSIQDIAEGIYAVMAENGMETEDVCAIPVSFDGIVDTESGIIYYPIHNSGWGRNIPVQEMLEQRIPWNCNIMVNNGSRYLSYGIFLKHPEYKDQNILSILAAAASTGGCLIDHGKLIQGAHGFMGEVGHVIIQPAYRKRRCLCGRYGCFETLVSMEAVSEYAGELAGEHGDTPLCRKILAGEACYRDVFAAADQGDAFAQAIVDRLVLAFESLIHNAALLCDPDMVSIGGAFSEGGSYFMEKLRERINNQSFFEIGNSISVVYSDLNGEDCAGEINIGAALYAVDEYLRTLEFV